MMRRLGVVASPEKGHETYIGRLVIPYLDKLGVYGLKFRCIQPHDCKSVNCAKYLQPDGQEVGLYNCVDLDSTHPNVHITEGEFDCMILSDALGEPVVGIPGTDAWLDHWPSHFSDGWERVSFWADGDKPGRAMAKRWRKDINNIDIINMPNGEDVNSVAVTQGYSALKLYNCVDEEDEPEYAMAA